MLRLLAALVPALRSAFRSRGELLLENIALRQQLATMVQRGRPRIRAVDRAFWIALRRVWSRWADILVIVKPETVVAWHRAGFRLYWRWLSRKGKRAGRQPLACEVRDLIRRMATENLWGAPRIHGELLELGFETSERTVSRYLRTLHLRPGSRQAWPTFLKNHRDAIVAMDLGRDATPALTAGRNAFDARVAADPRHRAALSSRSSTCSRRARGKRRTT